MSIQFAGSKSSDDRRRRRLVVNVDDPDADDAAVGEGLPGSGVASELVASAAAAPWVPVYEWRLWTYAVLMALFVSAAAFALTMPNAFRPELGPLTRHLLQGDRPVLAVLIQTTFCFLAAELAILIGWYRAQCKLDFRGHYRVWPWATALFAVAAICSATNLHGLVGEIVERTGLIPWRARVVSWMLPASLAALPLVLLLDRDVRRSRSSLYTLRVAWLLAVTSAWLELFATDLHSWDWVGPARLILPMYAMATVFVGLWLHARVVAYICPDPPDAPSTTALSQLMSGCRWLASKFVFRRAAAVPVAEVEAEAKPKRSRKKATTEEEEEAAPKRKKRAPAKRTTKPRTKAKAAEVEEEEVEDEAAGYESDGAAEYDGAADSVTPEAEAESNEWEEEEVVEEAAPPPPPPQPTSRSTRDTQQRQETSGKKGASSKYVEPEPEPEPEPEQEEFEDDESSEDAILRRDSGMSADQMKGLSKRQKRELRRQQQQRNQRR